MRNVAPVPAAPVAVMPVRPPCDQPDLAGLPTGATLYGAVCDARTRAWLAGVTVVVEELKQTALTDEHGVFAIRVAPGDYTVAFYYGDKTDQERVHVGPEALVLHAIATP